MWGIGLRWLRDRKVVEDYRILHGSEKTAEYRLSPIRATIERGTPLPLQKAAQFWTGLKLGSRHEFASLGDTAREKVSSVSLEEAARGFEVFGELAEIGRVGSRPGTAAAAAPPGRRRSGDSPRCSNNGAPCRPSCAWCAGET